MKSSQFYEAATINLTPILQIKKLRVRERLHDSPSLVDGRTNIQTLIGLTPEMRA